MTKRFFSFALLALFAAGFSLPAHAESANDYIRQQEATDPGYQSALKGGWNYGNTSNYSTYNPYPSNSYTPSYPYSNYQNYPYTDSSTVIESFWRGNCNYVVRVQNNTEYVTRTCYK